MGAAIIWLAGCATGRKVAVVEPVGPAPALSESGSGDGSLTVDSARVPAVVDLNREEWLMNNEFGHNDFKYEPAHTGYTIYTKSGELVETVRNAHDVTDPSPTKVALAPGAYRIEAEAINCHGSRIPVLVPVVIKPGEPTLVHLEGGWRPQVYTEGDVARLPCGRIIGWRASANESASTVTLER
jgi:hypothetical protein